MLRILIAEDDTVLRASLVKKLADHPQVEEVYAAACGKELYKEAIRIKPEVVISDIDLPGMSGLEAVERLREQLPDTEIIFITAYGQFIGEAVRLYACDFLEKPLDYQRLDFTLERIARKLRPGTLIPFTTEEGNQLVRPGDIYFVEAFRKNSIVYTKNTEFISTCAMKEIEDVLDKERFFKTGRSFLVNLEKIEGLKKDGRTSFRICFIAKDYRAYLSKNRYEEFRRAIKNLGGTGGSANA